jgi:hypothetical protein
MNVLFIGDIVGSRAVQELCARLPALRQQYAVDFVIANAENSASNGLGMFVSLNEVLFAHGVDVITGGNHSWDGPDVASVLTHPHVLRPANMPDGIAGKGSVVLSTQNEPITVINLAGQDAMEWETKLPAPLPLYPTWRTLEKTGAVIIDLHSGDVNLKQAFAHAVDGEAAAVLGTHTHEPTLPLHILPGGTALVVDVGMTGPLGGVQGFNTAPFVARLNGASDVDFSQAAPLEGVISLGAVLLSIDGGRTNRVVRIE